jgi:hypothetical protein
VFRIARKGECIDSGSIAIAFESRSSGILVDIERQFYRHQIVQSLFARGDSIAEGSVSNHPQGWSINPCF